jgi:hypothetical protein
MFKSSLGEGGKRSLFGGCNVITNRTRRGIVLPTGGNATGARNVYVFKVVRVRVYTARIRSASGFIFFNDREEHMAVEHLTDARGEDIGLVEE